MPYLGYTTPPITSPADDFLDLPDNRTHSMFDLTPRGVVHVRAIRLSRPDAIGQAFLGCFGLVTSLVVVLLLAYLLAHALYRGNGKRKERAQALRRFLKTDLGVYVLNLLVSDLFVPLSASANMQWSMKFIIHQSLLCDVQGALSQLGLCSAAIFNVLLASQTWSLLFLRRTPPPYLKWIFVPLAWTFALMMTFLGAAINTDPFSFFGPTSAGCWLALGSSHYFGWYTSMAVMSLGVLLTMAVSYVLLFLSLSGALKRIKARQWSSTGDISSTKVDVTATDGSSVAAKRRREVRAVARRMLWFPASYGILSIPLILCVLLGAKATPLPHVFYIAANSAFVSISLADVLIFLLTRQALLRPAPSTPSILPTSPSASRPNDSHPSTSTPSSQHPRPKLSTSSSMITTNDAPPFSRITATSTYSPKTSYPHFSYTTSTTTTIDPPLALENKPLPRLPIGPVPRLPSLPPLSPIEPLRSNKKIGGGGKRRSWTEWSARIQGEEDGVGLVRIGLGRGEEGRRYVPWDGDDVVVEAEEGKRQKGRMGGRRFF